MKIPGFLNIHKKTEPLPEKDWLYYDLQEACQSRVCPICFHLRYQEKQYLENIFYENVNDPPLRQKLRESPGFCDGHIRLILEMGDALGLAIIAGDIAAHLIKENKFNQASAPCFFCRKYEGREQRTVKAFGNYLNDSEFRNSLCASVGLCRRHHYLLFQLNKDVVIRNFLKKLLKMKMQKWLSQLNEFIRKNDYRFQDEKIENDETESIQILWNLFRR